MRSILMNPAELYHSVVLGGILGRSIEAVEPTYSGVAVGSRQYSLSVLWGRGGQRKRGSPKYLPRVAREVGRCHRNIPQYKTVPSRRNLPVRERVSA